MASVVESKEGIIRSLFETAILFLVIIGIDYALPGTALGDISPHPFWVPVIIISAQYGTGSGLIATITAVLLSLTVGLAVQGVNEDYYQYLVRIWSQPALWFGAAILIGELRIRHLNERDNLREELQELENQRQTIADHCKSLQSQIGFLQHELATSESQSAHTLLHQLHTLTKTNLQSEQNTVSETIVSLIGPCLFSIFEKTGSSFELVADHTSSEFESELNNPETLSDNIQQIVGGCGRYLFAANSEDAIELGDKALFAGPLINPDNYETQGIVVFKKLQPTMFSAQYQLLLQMVSEALGKAMMEHRQQ